MAPKVFLITGTSTGFGNEYVKEVLKHGDKVVATARDSSKLKFDGSKSDNFLALDLDVTKKSSIDAAFKAAIDKFGRIDVVVNNAGYGMAGEFESLKEEEIRKQVEVNFFGLLDVTRTALETLREQKPSGGVIQQLSSIGGQVGVPGFSLYCATKWAIEGFSEAVQQEVKPEWGIKFTCIEPGGFRTDFAGRSMTFADRHPAYDHINIKEKYSAYHGKQAGDPAKGSAAMYELAVMNDPPLRCILGTDAYKRVNQKMDEYRDNIKKFEKLSNGTDAE